MALPSMVFILLTERRYSSNKLVHASVGSNRHKVSEISYCMSDFTGDVYVCELADPRFYRKITRAL